MLSPVGRPQTSISTLKLAVTSLLSGSVAHGIGTDNNRLYRVENLFLTHHIDRSHFISFQTNLSRKMPPKRRLSEGSEDTEAGEDEAAGTIEEEEKVRVGPGRPKKKKVDPTQQMQVVFDFLRKYKKEDGTDLCATMVRLPNKRSDPGYYDIVENPIDVIKIQQKLRTDEYENMEDMKTDFELLVNNTKLYYKKNTTEFSDACLMEGIVTRTIDSVLAGEDPSQTIGDREEMSDLTEFLEDLLGTVMTTGDSGDSSRLLNTVFQLLPSRKRYPEYYEVIQEPMDLKIVAEKIQKNQYKEIAEMERDLQLIFSNARSFNEPGSQIYKDAGVLSKAVKSKSSDCQAGKLFVSVSPVSSHILNQKRGFVLSSADIF